MWSEHYITHSPEETRALAAKMVESLQAGDVLALTGELGSGKTCFVQGMARALGVKGLIWSPTFTLINEYKGTPFSLFHVDLYRLQSLDEIERIGLAEYFEREGVTVIEWAERAEPLLPARTIWVRFALGEKADEREILIEKPV